MDLQRSNQWMSTELLRVQWQGLSLREKCLQLGTDHGGLQVPIRISQGQHKLHAALCRQGTGIKSND